VQTFCSGKAISITYSEWILVALGVYNAKHMSYTHICGLSGSIHYFPTLSP